MRTLKKRIRKTLVELGICTPTIYEIYYGFESDYSWAEVFWG
jgi:hypothetical protein